MKVVIVEDEFYAAEKLKNELIALNPKIEVLQVLDSCAQCLIYFKDPPEYDIIFSDIHLADGLCFHAFEQLQIDKPIIFTTAYDKYALEAFETNGIDYLLKPIQSQRLQQALDKFSGLQSNPDNSSLYNDLKELMRSSDKEYKSRFLCKLGNKIKSIPVSSIMYFYSKDKMSFLVDDKHNRYPVNHTLDEIDGMMNPKDFFRLNRQYIVHFNAIQEIHPYFKGRLKIKIQQHNDDGIIVSTERSPLMRAWLDR